MFEQKNATHIDDVTMVVTRRTVHALQMQGMTCPQAICELVDNALAAARPGEQAKIAIALAPDNTCKNKEYFLMAIADWGIGMDAATMKNAIQLGAENSGNNRLNEHGFGLKNALSALAKDEPFVIFSRTEKGPYTQISSPFDTHMPVYSNPAPDIPDGLNLKWTDPSTIILMRVPTTSVRSLQRKNQYICNLSTIRSWVLEHLGVTYRGFLESDPMTLHEASAKIMITLNKDEQQVPALKVPMMDTKKIDFHVNLNGQDVAITYEYGILDETLRDIAVSGKKFKYYYQGNQATQGIDIRIGNRVIAKSQLNRIWKKHSGEPITTHNQYNDFVGELQIPDLPRGVLTTLANKTGINPDDTDWDTVFDELQPYPPIKNAKKMKEQELCNALQTMLKRQNNGCTVQREVAVWGSGDRIDVLLQGNGKCVIYEMKIGTVADRDVYQMRMYWDGLLKVGTQPTKAVLVVKRSSDTIQDVIDFTNECEPHPLPKGKPSLPHNFSVMLLEDFGLDI